jgi:hypothetical protein
MDRMGHHQIQTTQYLLALPEADRKNLDALERISRGTNRWLDNVPRIEGCQSRQVALNLGSHIGEHGLGLVLAPSD